jgi:hypothetical protein
MTLPEPARRIAGAVTAAIDAAAGRDAGALREAATRLAALNPEQVGLVVGAMTRALLEDLHPDGLRGDDVRAVVERCVLDASAWYPAVDADVVVGLLSDALDVPRPFRAPEPGEVATHGPLLVADLLAAGGRRLDGYLAAAFAEIARAELVEPP